MGGGPRLGGHLPVEGAGGLSMGGTSRHAPFAPASRGGGGGPLMGGQLG